MKEQSIPSIEQQSHPCIQPSDVHDFEQILLKREQSYAIMLENLTVYGVDVDDGNLSPAESKKPSSFPYCAHMLVNKRAICSFICRK